MTTINIGTGDLETILAVAQTGSFRAAAQVLHVSQPSVSARVRHVEDVLGVKLFHRTTRKVLITEHGKRLCIRAEHTISELRSVLQEFKDEAQLKRGRVVVGATPAVAATVLSGVINQFVKRWPGVEVILRDDFFGRSLDRLGSGEVDFVISPFRETGPPFGFEPLYREEILVVAPDGHPLLEKGSVAMSTVARYPLLTMPSQSAIWEIISDAFATEKVPFMPAFQTLHHLTLLAMVKSGSGITILPRLLLGLLNMESLGTARIGRAGLYRKVGIITAHGRAIQPAVESFMNALRLRLHRDEPAD